jgi:hypothetical protein
MPQLTLYGIEVHVMLVYSRNAPNTSITASSQILCRNRLCNAYAKGFTFQNTGINVFLKAYTDRMERKIPKKVYDNRFGAPPVTLWKYVVKLDF